MEEICRLCLIDTTTYDKYTSYNEQINLLMPEIDLNITPTFILCEDCSTNLDSAYTFKQKCLRIEERIQNYISTTPLINLRCVRDEINGDSKDSLDQVIVKVEEAYYDEVENDAVTNSTNLDYKDTNSINEEYHLTFPKEENVEYDKDANNDCKEEMEEVESESLKVFVCEICTEPFETSTELEQHRIIHSKTNVFPCKSCSKIFSQESYLTEHEIIHSNEAIRYFCEICNKGFKFKRSLTNHEVVHSKQTYTCSICSKSWRNLELHMRKCRSSKHVCKFCDMKFVTKSGLAKHMQMYTGDHPDQCEVCLKGFPQKCSLSVHISSHQNEESFMCKICSKVFAKKALLKAHMVIHMPSAEKPFICEISTCRNVFKTEHSYKRHMRRHRVGRQFQCSLCDKGFFDATGLKSHMACHTGERPYECDVCHQNFAHKTSWKRHLKTHRAKKV